MDKTELPWLCPLHPDAQIRHEWDRTEHATTFNGERRVFARTDANHVYLCAKCGRKLAPPKEADDGRD